MSAAFDRPMVWRAENRACFSGAGLGLKSLLSPRTQPRQVHPSPILRKAYPFRRLLSASVDIAASLSSDSPLPRESEDSQSGILRWRHAGGVLGAADSAFRSAALGCVAARSPWVAALEEVP